MSSFLYMTNANIFVYFKSNNTSQEPNVILETPASSNTMNRSGNDKLYTLEEQDKKRAKEEKKAKKKKDKKDKVVIRQTSINIS